MDINTAASQGDTSRLLQLVREGADPNKGGAIFHSPHFGPLVSTLKDPYCIHGNRVY